MKLNNRAQHVVEYILLFTGIVVVLVAFAAPAGPFRGAVNSVLYMIFNEISAEDPNEEYSWQIGPCTECTLECAGYEGPGEQTCSYICVDSNQNQVEISKCSGNQPAPVVQECNTEPCDVDGGWSDWNCGVCSQICDPGTGPGTMECTRTCTEPPPLGDGAPCSGPSSEFQDCGTELCCGNGQCEASYGENCFSCTADCGACCGNGQCEAQYNEDCAACEADCGECPVNCTDEDLGCGLHQCQPEEMAWQQNCTQQTSGGMEQWTNGPFCRPESMCYQCQGAVDPNASWCPGDTQNLPFPDIQVVHVDPGACTSPTKCEAECNPTFIATPGGCVCPPSFTLQDGICQCLPPRVLQDGACEECPDGTVYDPGTGECETAGQWINGSPTPDPYPYDVDPSCSSICSSVGRSPAVSPEGMVCASGEVRPCAGGIDYQHGTAGSGSCPPSGSPQTIEVPGMDPHGGWCICGAMDPVPWWCVGPCQYNRNYCYHTGQTQNGQNTDRIVACYCE